MSLNKILTFFLVAVIAVGIFPAFQIYATDAPAETLAEVPTEVPTEIPAETANASADVPADELQQEDELQYNVYPVELIPPSAFADTAGIPEGPAVDYAAAHGYLYLYADNSLAYPNNPITRGEWAFTLEHWLRYLQPVLTEMGFAPEEHEVLLEDISGNVFYNSIHYLSAHGLTEADLYLFRPGDLITRQEICDYMAKLLPMLNIGPDYALDTSFILSRYWDRADLLPWYEWQIAFMTEAGLIGFYAGEELIFAPEKPYGRGEMCEMLLSAETMLRQKIRGRKPGGLEISPDLEIKNIDVTNITPTGYNAEITINDAAIAINPHVIIAYTQEDDRLPAAEDFLSGEYYTQTKRLTEMRRIRADNNETTYSAIMRGRPGESYNLFVILKNGAEYSNIAEYTVNLPYAEDIREDEE